MTETINKTTERPIFSGAQMNEFRKTLNWGLETKRKDANKSYYVTPGLPERKTKTEKSTKVIDFIKQQIFLEFGLSFEEYDIDSRKREIVYCRHCFVYLVRKHTPISLVGIGNLWAAKRDHSTQLNSIKVWGDLTDTIPELRNKTAAIRTKIIERFN